MSTKHHIEMLLAAGKRIARRRTVLEDGAPPGGASPEPFVPRFKDDEKLLAAVVSRARNSSDYERKLVNAVADLAGNDKTLRGVLRKALLPVSQTSRGRAAKPNGYLRMLAAHARILEKQNIPPGKIEEALGRRYNLSPSRIRALVARGKKLLGDDWI